MLFLLSVYVLSSIVCYRTMKGSFIKYLKHFKKDGYTMRAKDGKSIKRAMLFTSLIPGVHSLYPFMHLVDLLSGREKAYENVRNEEAFNGSIYKTDNFENIDSVIKDLEENDLRLQINKITKLNDIKDKIKLNKIMDVFKLNKNKNENEIAQLIANELDLNEAISQLQKDIGALDNEMSYHDLMDERMKSVPVIHVIDEESTKDIDDAIVIPTIDFSISNDDEAITRSQTMHR